MNRHPDFENPNLTPHEVKLVEFIEGKIERGPSMKYISIPVPDCSECPHRDHRGAFGDVAYVPFCRKSNKELPHELGAGHRGRIIALSTNVIPDWCPLPDNEDSYKRAREDYHD